MCWFYFQDEIVPAVPEDVPDVPEIVQENENIAAIVQKIVTEKVIRKN